MDVSVIIVNYNTCQLTLQCLRSIYINGKDINYEIILVDNASIDNSVELIKKEFPHVNLILNSENLGFGRANNIGIKKALGKYLLLLNSDTRLINNALKIFFDYIEKNNLRGNIGAIGCIMYDNDMHLNYKNSFFSFPSIFVFYNETFKNIFKVRKKYTSERKCIEKSGQIPVDFIVGADLFIPKNVINTIGSFDPDYFIYWEEADLQYRMYKENLDRFIISGPKIIHLEGGSTIRNLKDWQRRMETQSLLTYFRKHANYLSIFLIKTHLLIINIKSIVLNKYTLKEQIEYIKLVVKK